MYRRRKMRLRPWPRQRLSYPEVRRSGCSAPRAKDVPVLIGAAFARFPRRAMRVTGSVFLSLRAPWHETCFFPTTGIDPTPKLNFFLLLLRRYIAAARNAECRQFVVGSTRRSFNKTLSRVRQAGAVPVEG